MSNNTEALKAALPELMESLRKCHRRYGEVGTRDVDIAEWNAGIDAAIAQAGNVLAALAQPEARPLTREQKRAMWKAATIELCSHENCYLRGIADAEAAHNITAAMSAAPKPCPSCDAEEEAIARGKQP